jgi:F-type H+-transporting ATPase subunit delta
MKKREKGACLSAAFYAKPEPSLKITTESKMAAATGSGIIAQRYAVSLLDMAEEAKSVEAVEKDVNDLLTMVEASPDLQTLIKNPLFSRTQQSNAVLALAKKAGFNKLTSNFLGVLVANRRLPYLEAAIKAFRTELTKRRGEMEAFIETAYALTPAQTDKLQKQLSKTLGTNVTLNVQINKELLGGLTVTVGSRMIDNSVRRKLERLQIAMNANEPQQKKVG